MSEQLNISVPDDLMEWVATSADREFRTPEGQVLWLLKRAWGEDARPGTNEAAKRQLAEEMQALRTGAGLPGYRVIADRIRRRGGTASHSTVFAALNGDSLPSWAVVEGIVNALDGNAEHFRALWVKAHGGQS